MKHRPEIDGLRAVAVVPVILFHAGLTAVPGGFVGVDVFFVISGFLITSILLTDLEQNRFDLWAFYERRARRIAPALIVVLLVSLVVGWALLLPGDFANLGRSVLATALFGANIHFGRTIDYFAAEAEQQPMLHMWSLSIEEQYYFVLPLLMWVVWRRFGRQGLAVALAILAAASLIGSEWGARTAPAFNYFFSLSRAWELLAGSLCALLAARTQPAPRELPAAGGLAMIIAAYVLFDETTSYPALPTLLPVVGTALILLYAAAGTLTARLLSMPPLVGIGLISYSLYLWHQPVFAFGRIALGEETSALVMAAQTGLVFALGWASWAFVEQPFRRPRPRRPLLPYVAVAIAALVGSGYAAKHLPETARRFQIASPWERELLALRTDYRKELPAIYLEGTCFHNTAFPADLDHCLRTPASPTATLIWGDSHAAALSFGLLAARDDFSLIGTSGCPPLLSTSLAIRSYCRANNARMIDIVAKAQPAQVILHGNWAGRKTQLQTLPETLRALRKAAPAARLTVLGGVPQWQPSLPDKLVNQHLVPDPLARLDTDLSRVRAADQRVQQLLDSARDVGNVRFVSALDLLCPDGRCAVYAPWKGRVMPIIWDYGHLTAGGSVLVAERLLPSLR